MILIKGLQRYQRSKLEFRKNICQLGWPRAHGFEPGWSADIFYELQLWPLVSLQPLDQNQCLVPHLKDLFHICLETKIQGFWMTFNLCNLGSKYTVVLFARICIVLHTIFCLSLFFPFLGRKSFDYHLQYKNEWTWYINCKFCTRNSFLFMLLCLL